LSGVTEDQSVDGETDKDDAAWDAFTHASRRRGGGGGGSAVARRRLVVLLAVLTTVALVAIAVIVVVLKGGSDKASPGEGRAAQIDSAHKALNAHQRSCPDGSDQLSCRREAAEALSLAYRNFNIDLDRITVPNTASEARDILEEDAELLSSAYDDLSVATTNAAYDRLVARDGLGGLRAAFDRHYAALVAAVRAG
jgi:hypothetical protein